MSSYHIVNAIWVGVFPMLAVTVIIGIICYILCCLNQLKIKFTEHRKRKALKKAKLKMLKQTRKQLELQKKQQPQQQQQIENDQISVNFSLIKPISRPNSFKTPLNRPYLTSSAGELFTLQPQTPIEQLVVQELNESPKSTYSRLQNLKKLEQEKKKSQSNAELSSTIWKQIEKETSSQSSSKCSLTDNEHIDYNTTTQNDYDDDESSSTCNSCTYKSHSLRKIKSGSKSMDNMKKSTTNRLKTRFLNNNRSKQVKNRIMSDVDIDDDLIFNDDDDSLSSTGVGTSSSQNLSLNKLTAKKMTEPTTADTCLNVTSTTTGSSNTITMQTVSVLNPSLSAAKELSSSKNIFVNASSMSDIDPDDNILKDLLVKNVSNTKSILLTNKKNVNFK